MENAQLYRLRNYGETTLWLLAALLAIIGVKMNQPLLVKASAYVLIILAVYLICTYLYFKKSPVLRGVSATSKLAIVGTFVLAALLFLAAYYILAHAPA